MLRSLVVDHLHRILGSGNANLPKIAQILVRILGKGTELADEETITRIAVLLRHMESTFPAEVRSHVSLVLKIMCRCVVPHRHFVYQGGPL